VAKLQVTVTCPNLRPITDFFAIEFIWRQRPVLGERSVGPHEASPIATEVSEQDLARVGPTTPTRARRPLRASVDPTDARNDSWPAMPFRARVSPP
jgi:hypothetical protein